ncbi:hypothetical protein U91I_01494 [alpha proteobacterium U9-1i]|nr:hypothetical protein U91I_01494 [alpha proteobacterium U9-1i]
MSFNTLRANFFGVKDTATGAASEAVTPSKIATTASKNFL